MVGRVVTLQLPSMSMQYSTIELTALILTKYLFHFLKKYLFLFTAYINEKLIINKVKLKSLKKEPLGNNGTKFNNIKIKAQSEDNFVTL